MKNLTSLATFFLALFTTLTIAKPAQVKYIQDFHFAPTTSNQLDCPAAGQTTFTGPLGGQWGILCAWDTVTKNYRWGPIKKISFQECILKCGQLDGCTVAAYDGTCYLKTSAEGEGFVSKGNQKFRVAAKLN